MCGICGMILNNGENIDESLLARMTHTLAHRGPDDMGLQIFGSVSLGFRRLAILDLSPSGHQPMASEDEQLWIVFNGEIYNFIELRQEIENKGYRFRSQSDTEVLLYLYQEYGTSMFSLLNGMFAIGIFDRKTNQLVLARDRLGKKPLFYWISSNGIGFASELRALRKIPGFPKEISSEALALYIRLGWVPNWTCIHPGVAKLPPGCWLTYHIKDKAVTGPTPFWTLPPVSICHNITEKEWLDKIEALLWDATRIRLRADVPLGIFLSSGIDSGLIAAAVATQQAGNLFGLTISFPQWSEDEAPLARRTGRHLGYKIISEELHSNVLNALPSIIGHFDEPFADASALPTDLICEVARKHFTVVLSGDGGDELFAGYENYLRASTWRFLESIPLQVRRLFSHGLIKFTKSDSRERRFLRRLGFPLGRWGIGGKLYPFEDWISVCIRPEYQLSIDQIVGSLDTFVEGWPTATPIDQAQRQDIRLYMLDDVLVKVDRMSMRHSLEVRSPFLDYRMVELALSIPPQLRTYQGHSKYLLRRLASRYLPPKAALAPKRGFGIPMKKWLLESSHTKFLREIINSPASDLPDPLTSTGAEKLWQLAETNEALLPALFRLLAYRWWSYTILASN